MLSEEFVRRVERSVREYVRVALQHVPHRRTNLRKPSLHLLLLFRSQPIYILETIMISSAKYSPKQHEDTYTFCHAYFFSANVLSALYSGSVMIARSAVGLAPLSSSPSSCGACTEGFCLSCSWTNSVEICISVLGLRAASAAPLREDDARAS